MDSLRQAVEDLCEWRADHEHILRPLGLCSGLPPLQGRGPNTVNSTNSDASSKRAGPMGGGEAGIAKMDVDGNASQKREIGSDGAGGGGAGSRETGEKITLQNLSACIHAAEKIAVGRSLKEVREMRTVLQRANDWIEQCQSLCPRRQSKRRVQPSSKPTFDRLKSLIAEGLASPVGVTDEVNRVRRHIAEAESCQQSAQSVIDKACSDLADQTVERKDLWRKEDEECRQKGNSRQEQQPSEKPKDSEQLSVEVAEEDKSDENRGQGKPADAGNDGDSDDDSDDVDREDELDEAEEAIGKALEQLLLTSRDISVFMPEELVAEKVQKIIGWARYENTRNRGDGPQGRIVKDKRA